MNCICSVSGFCEKHKVNKGKHWLKLCQTEDEYYQAWENGIGPGQSKDHPSSHRRVGSELKKLISWFPIPNKADCKSCRSLEGRMNGWGADKCEEKMEFILKKLHLAARRRKLPFSKHLVTILVNKAIRNSRS